MLFSKLLGTSPQASSTVNILYMWGNNSQGTLGKSFVGVSSISSPIQVDSSQWSRLSVGTLHTLAIKSNGTLWAWGGNLYGQCGYATAAGQYKSSPVSIGTGWQTVDVSLGGTWALGIKTDGTLWAWGANAAGQLGNLSLTATSSPVLVSGPAGASWSAISAGTGHALAITTLGRLYAWGNGVSGRLGDLSIVTKSSPVLVSGPAATSWLAVSAGGGHSIAITTGQVGYIWGNGTNGQLGNGSTVFNLSSPVITTSSPTTSIAAGETHTLVLFQGRPYATGSASAGQLGNSSLLQVSGFVVVSGPAATSWTSVSAGLSHSAGITAAGRLYAWGLNTSGQVGINSLTSVSSPVLVSGPAATSWSFVRIKNQTSLAITTVGALYAWGNNTLGNLGIGTLGTYSSPVAVQSPASGSWTVASASLSFGQFVDSQNNFYFAGDGLTYFYPTTVASIPQQVGTSSWTAVSAGDGFSLCITTEGRLFSWGYNLNGEGGRLTTTDTFTPTLVSGPAATSWSAVAAAGQFSLGITSLGALYAWGLGTSGRLGDGTIVSKSSPIKIGSSSWNAVGAGAGTGYGIDAVGRLFAWGLNTSGQVGISTLIRVSSPVLVSGPASTSWVQVAGGGLHVMAATTTRALYAWGLGTSGQLGTNAALTVSSPVLVASPTRPLSWQQISTGQAHSLGIRSDKTLWAWGSGGLGQLGSGTSTSVSSPIQIGTSSWSAVAAGLSSSYAIRSDGTLWSWGGNSVGQLGILSTIATSSPVLVSGPAGASWAAISASGGYNNAGSHALGITNQGRLYAWGYNIVGALGDSSAINKSSPVLVSGPATTSWLLISAGSLHSLGVTTTGRLWAWGAGGEGELGDLTTTDKLSPVLVSGPATTSWASVVAGSFHSLAITTTGLLYAWGWNANGQLGDLSVVTKSSPVLVSGPATTSWSVLYAGGGQLPAVNGQSYAITTLGRLYAWGNNSQGQLGDNTTVSKSSPILVSGPASTSWSAMSSGGQANATVIAITTAGLGYGWGANIQGQAGINSLTNVSSPIVIQARDITSWALIGAGLSHSVGISNNGLLYAWGNNTNGQLGDLTTTNRSSPILVSGPSATSWANLGTGYAGNFAGAITGNVVIPPIPPVIVTGQVAYTTPGTYSWTCPANVTSVSVVTVGGGGGKGATAATYLGGGGGGLGYKNNISVTPGTLYTVVVGAGGGAGANGAASYFISALTVQGGGGTYAGAGGTYVGDGGGNGGASNTGSFSGGGGAGGYTGNGGAAGVTSGGTGPGNAGSGGGGGGGSSYYATAGGGVGILGQGANGTAGGTGGASSSAGGGGGSGGENGKGYGGTGAGALYGGGGLMSDGGGSVDGGNGAVRIIWPGTTRQFPSTNTGDL
jgi:alpha-tubulin suppressor-like RCC1 family protein